MGFDPERYHRRTIRLQGYDYAQDGSYFVTICTFDRGCLFGDVLDGEMHLTPFGVVIQRHWENLPQHYPAIALDVFVVMPNHVHGIVILGGGIDKAAKGKGDEADQRNDGEKNKEGRAGQAEYGAAQGKGRAGHRPAPTLGEVMRGFKAFSAKEINILRGTAGPVWQRNYYEHIIRDERSLQAIRQYIIDNPARWAEDAENPARGRP